MIFLDKL